jgi:hypothetical protein
LAFVVGGRPYDYAFGRRRYAGEFLASLRQS